LWVRLLGLEPRNGRPRRAADVRGLRSQIGQVLLELLPERLQLVLLVRRIDDEAILGGVGGRRSQRPEQGDRHHRYPQSAHEALPSQGPTSDGGAPAPRRPAARTTSQGLAHDLRIATRSPPTAARRSITAPMTMARMIVPSAQATPG